MLTLAFVFSSGLLTTTQVNASCDTTVKPNVSFHYFTKGSSTITTFVYNINDVNYLVFNLKDDVSGNKTTEYVRPSYTYNSDCNNYSFNYTVPTGKTVVRFVGFGLNVQNLNYNILQSTPETYKQTLDLFSKKEKQWNNRVVYELIK